MAVRQADLAKDEEWKYAELSLRWHGWGSPVGLGIFVLAVGITAALIRFAYWA